MTFAAASHPDLQARASAEAEARRRRVQTFQPVFRGNAAILQDATDHELMLAGPAETGKTFATCWHLDTLLRRYAGSRGALVRKTRASMDATVLQTYRGVAARRGGIHPYGGSKPEWFDYGGGSRLYVVGMDKPEKVLSGEFDFIYVNQAEELSLHDWETLTTRATGRAGNAPPQIFGDCNPGPPLHWIRQRAPLRFLESRHGDNPTLYDEAGQLTDRGQRTMQVLDALTGVRYHRLRHGRWVGAEGVVYEDYDPTIHLIDRFPIPPDWRRIRVIDFGYTNPFVCQWWAIDGDGRMYRYREIYMTGRTVRAHLATIQHESAGEQYEATIADHDAEDRATLAEGGIVTLAATKTVSPGIQNVQERLRRASDGRPRMVFLRDSLVERDASLADAKKPTCTEEEFDGYIWQPGADGRPQKEQPLKLHDHGMDTARYGAMYVDGAQVNLRWL
jgi:phage terminase large subunit